MSEEFERSSECIRLEKEIAENRGRIIKLEFDQRLLLQKLYNITGDEEAFLRDIKKLDSRLP